MATRKKQQKPRARKTRVAQLERKYTRTIERAAALVKRAGKIHDRAKALKPQPSEPELPDFRLGNGDGAAVLDSEPEFGAFIGDVIAELDQCEDIMMTVAAALKAAGDTDSLAYETTLRRASVFKQTLRLKHALTNARLRGTKLIVVKEATP